MSWWLIVKDVWWAMPDLDSPHILILGGTAEAARLAANLTERYGAQLTVTTSLAGLTLAPGPLAGTVRRGGFGGEAGLAAWLQENRVQLVVDATHPFARQISANARRACDRENIPRLMLVRKPWHATAVDRWHDVPNLERAATLVSKLANRVFLSIGSVRLGAFAGLGDVHLVVRMIDPPVGPLPLDDYSVITGKGPFDEKAERKLLQEERIGALVSRNSGASATFGKIEAARALNLPVVMVASPTREVGEHVESLEGAVQWIADCVADIEELRL